MSDTSSPVLFDRLPAANGAVVGLLTLNVEKTLNALSLDMVDLMQVQLSDWRDDDEIVAVFMRGAGDKAFCAGGDIQALYESMIAVPGGPCDRPYDAPCDRPYEYAEAFFEREYRLNYLLHTYPKPVLSWGHGIVMGGGLGVHAGARHKIVTEKTRFAMPEIGIGLFPDVGGTWFLNRMPGKTGLFVALTAAPINAGDALYLGLGNYFVHNVRQQEIIDALLAVDWQFNASIDNELVGHTLAELDDSDVPNGNVEKNLPLINTLCGADTSAKSAAEIVDAILAIRSDDKWLSSAVGALAQGSPTSACAIFQQLRGGAELSLADVFRRELVLATNIARDAEFAEGVRALLIDKDRQPRWRYPQVSAVPDSLIEQLFTPPWANNPLADLE